MSQNISSLEKSAYKFIEELHKISIETKLLHPSELEKTDKLISCIKDIMIHTKQEVEAVEKRFKT